MPGWREAQHHRHIDTTICILSACTLFPCAQFAHGWMPSIVQFRHGSIPPAASNRYQHRMQYDCIHCCMILNTEAIEHLHLQTTFKGGGLTQSCF